MNTVFVNSEKEESTFHELQQGDLFVTQANYSVLYIKTAEGVAVMLMDGSVHSADRFTDSVLFHVEQVRDLEYKIKTCEWRPNL